MVDIHAARQAYKAQEIRNRGFVTSSRNLADGPTKPKVQAALHMPLKTIYHTRKVEQLIIRDPQ